MQTCLKQKQEHTNNFGAMESGDHSKNGASPKSQTIRGNLIKKTAVFCFAVFICCVSYGQTADDLRTKAEQGDAAAQNDLGSRYCNGSGVEKNYTEAVKWFSKAAEQGNATAQYNLGICYDNGFGVEKNSVEAVKRYRKSAEQGYADAQHNLGYKYYKGEGVEKNYTEAVKWFAKAAEQGLALSQYMLGVCYHNGYGEEENKNKALYWYEKALNNKSKLNEKQIAVLETRIKELKEKGHLPSLSNLVLLDKQEYDFGTVVVGTEPHVIFRYRNDSPQEINIERIGLPCSCCIKAEASNKNIKPGEIAEIKVTCIKQAEDPRFTKSIRIFTGENQYGLTVRGTTVKKQTEGEYSEGLVVVKQLYKYGFQDKEGKEIIPLKYEGALNFSDGLAAVKLNKKWGFIDKTDKIVIPFKYENNSIVFSEGLAYVILNGKFGFIDKKGKEIIPLKYENASKFVDGLAVVKLNGKWGGIDKKGKEIIPIKYENTYMPEFKDGLVAVKLNGKWGFIDKTDKIVIPLKYDDVDVFESGVAKVKLGNEEFYIDKNGNKTDKKVYDYDDWDW